MAVSAGDIISVSCRFGFHNLDDQVNKLHVRVGTPPSPNDDASLSEDILGWVDQFYTELAPAISDNVGTTDITLYNVTEDAPVGQYSWPTLAGGEATAEPLPPQATMLVLLRTGLKRRLGRMYLPTFTESHQNGGVWGSGTIALVESVYPSFMIGSTTGPNGTIFIPVVYSPTDGLGYSVTSFRVLPTVATMKSRKVGRGS